MTGSGSIKKNKVAVFVESKKFDHFILIVILVNTVSLGFDTSEFFVDKIGFLLEAINYAAIGIFVVEAILKLVAWRGFYFKDGWNVFDFCIIVISLVPTGGVFSGIRVLRVLRILRSLRMISNLKPLRKIVQAIFSSLPGIGWTGLLMALVYYIYAVIGINLFSDIDPEQFGSFPLTLVTLFSLTTMEGWQDTVFPFTNITPAYWIYFLSFLILSAFILLNLIVGIVVDNIDKASALEDNEDAKDTKEVSHSELSAEMKKLKEQLDHVQALLDRQVR